MCAEKRRENLFTKSCIKLTFKLEVGFFILETVLLGKQFCTSSVPPVAYQVNMRCDPEHRKQGECEHVRLQRRSNTHLSLEYESALRLMLYRSHLQGSISPKSRLDYLTLEDATDMLSGSFRIQVRPQKSEDSGESLRSRILCFM